MEMWVGDVRSPQGGEERGAKFQQEPEKYLFTQFSSALLIACLRCSLARWE